jgi:hypothetical protein
VVGVWTVADGLPAFGDWPHLLLGRREPLGPLLPQVEQFSDD